MHPITLVFIADIVIILMVITKLLQKKVIEPKWIEGIKQVGGFALAYGTFGTIVGFFFAFSDLSATTEPIPFNVISGGVMAALINVVYGLIVFIISLVAYILIKLFGEKSIA